MTPGEILEIVTAIIFNGADDADCSAGYSVGNAMDIAEKIVAEAFDRTNKADAEFRKSVTGGER